jgi:hypothetical protein
MDDSMDFSHENLSVIMEEEDSDLSTRALNQASKVDDHSSSIASKLLQGWTFWGIIALFVLPLLFETSKACYSSLSLSKTVHCN